MNTDRLENPSRRGIFHSLVVMGVAALSPGRLMAETDDRPIVPSKDRSEEAVKDLLEESIYLRLQRHPAVWRIGFKPEEKRRFIALLLPKLLSNRPLDLRDYGDMVVRSRVESKKMDFAGHGAIFRQDIFIECGRAAWALELLLGIELPLFTDGMKEADRLNAFEKSCQAIMSQLKFPGEQP